MTLFSRFSAGTGLKIAVPLVILILAGAGGYALIATAPKARRMPPVTAAPTVETAAFTRGSHPVTLSVMGTVVAAHEISLTPQVEGKIVETAKAFVPGGFFAKGEEMLRIDPSDYELALREVKADVADAEYDLKVELGYQNVAAREWKLLRQSAKGTMQDADLALRKPHLEKAKADLEAARARLAQAELDLSRTTIVAPFPAVVESVAANLGATVSKQETLATLVGTEEFWVQATVPVDRLDRIRLPGADNAAGADAVVVSGTNGLTSRRAGAVIRLLPSLESEGRMARVLVSVRDPLNIKGDPSVRPLLLGSYVKVLIDGGEVTDSFAIPRKAFRDNGKIWVLGSDGKMEIRSVAPVWRDAETVLLTEGLAEGEQVVLSSINAPLDGMRLESASVKAAASPEPGGGSDVANATPEGGSHDN
ncbi:efflux RND transporter periplasmic adaptor subunit [Pseudodesulfovibrio sp.]|uniref:efflux RND transporter periplasmic adaptor subunit n=1 Tax=Pseudodesulfovibrio sp. TaxID=2035812 RepID=UPI0026269E53|nr:efflux RND transporter periplasmic adaptor subunit [Pseudodesulfovibrio sp.]MDD3311160.1 efflux RND transporter periplasmic adaptor subunit [Pseudodesulfovibrio sp.]